MVGYHVAAVADGEARGIAAITMESCLTGVGFGSRRLHNSGQGSAVGGVFHSRRRLPALFRRFTHSMPTIERFRIAGMMSLL